MAPIAPACAGIRSAQAAITRRNPRESSTTPWRAGRRSRLVTMFLESARAPAAELAALYHERWKMEIAHDELKTLLREALCVLRSKTPDLVQQEAWGFLLTHFSLRALMREAALGALSHGRVAADGRLKVEPPATSSSVTDH